MTKLIVAFRNFASAPKKKRPTLKITMLHLIWLRSTNSSLLWKFLLQSFVRHKEKKDVSNRLRFLERATQPCDRIWYNLGIIHPFVVSTTILLLQVPSSSSSSYILLPSYHLQKLGLVTTISATTPYLWKIPRFFFPYTLPKLTIQQRDTLLEIPDPGVF